ncbi:MAG: LamG domain-containing protein, partial [Holophagales bacterium]|nr:LamG domain-containing protein [Holophagales bacterium]
MVRRILACTTYSVVLPCAALLVAVSFVPTPADAQLSQGALRFYGTGVGPPGQQDRALLAVDDNAPGPDASTPVDLGQGSFTIELWLRGQLADNPTGNSGGDVEVFDYTWIEGDIVLDRDVWCGTERAYGVSLAGGLVRFGTGSGDGPVFDSTHTMEGSEQVLDGQWHHVAVVRDADTGIKRIYVDGVLD